MPSARELREGGHGRFEILQFLRYPEGFAKSYRLEGREVLLVLGEQRPLDRYGFAATGCDELLEAS